ncbi:MAG: (d)CMP kinase [Candidatus Omnitrophica bacterium]|nr:(d)CMP kinase [Candidatus Omnitrophota bacterium]MBU0895908.1 (d)CMP kinase [Candidatus Omnitrophota bacterium]MBU1809182.1 (d)CMP kinase [Candidatus Omnitrophota bacterium]
MPGSGGHFIVAIDGPAGSGKSTVSKLIAEKLGLVYIDTGSMYRALTLKAMRLKIDLEDGEALTELARSTKIDLLKVSSSLKVLLDGEDVSGLIRTPELTNNVKFIARVSGVRQEMVNLQRVIGGRSSAVLEGRDIGTVVFPEAMFKFYLDADVEERSRRRYKELSAVDQRASLNDIKHDVVNRDESDIKRDVGALKRASDAVFVDTTDLSIEEVVERLLSYIK